MRFIRQTTILAIVLIISTINVLSQEMERPKIGLVLSGGGAKGLAHIGVLQAIDSAGLKIDYITGTSMGAILAAMYASGYSGKEIERIAREMDWSSAMSGAVGYDEISIEQKDDYGSTFELPMNGFKLQPSTGFMEPQEVMLKFSEVFFPVYKIKDFSELQIPFKCVATDLRNGDAVILDSGDIAFAVRSSMAIPGVFSATDYKNTKLVDGGIVRNFPVKDVKDMGADFVIGVNLFEGLTSPENMSSMIDVLLQVTNFRDAKDLIEEKKICDMIIEPNVSQYSSASFSSSDALIAIGDSIGKEFYPLFKDIADRMHDDYGVEYSLENRMAPYDTTVRINSFIFEGLKNTHESLLMHNLNLERGENYTPVQLNEAFRRAYSSRNYNKLSYELIPTDDSTNNVTLKTLVDEVPLASAKIGLSYNTFTSASLILGYGRRNLLGERSLTEFKIALSEALRFRIGNRIYFGKNYNFYSDLRYDYTHYEVPVFGTSKTRKDYIYKYSHNDFSVCIAKILNLYSEWNLRCGYESFKLKPDVTGSTTAYKGNVYEFYVNLRRRVDKRNRKFLTQSGYKIDLNAYVAFKPDYDLDIINSADTVDASFERKNIYRITAEFDFYQPCSKNFTLFENVSLAASYGAQIFVHNTFLGGVHKFLPSHFSFFGLTTAQRYESTFAMGRIGVQYKLFGDFYTQFHYNSAVTFTTLDDCIDNNDKFKVKKYLHGFGVTAAYNLLQMLPFDMTLMYSPNYKFNVSVNIGIPF